jgi:hypothetical protein
MSQADRSGQQTRREFLQSGALALGSTRLALKPRADRRCIVLFLTGGPSHIDTFDPKPEAPAEYRGPFGSIPTAIPGVRFSELLPRSAARARRFAIVRSLHHTAAPTHETGRRLLQIIPASNSREMDGPAPERYGDTLFGRRCFRALQQVDTGTRLVMVHMFDAVEGAISWDCHANGGSLNTTFADYRSTVAPTFDWAVSALLDDLADRGLLDATLVVAVGEFGRSPRLNLRGGRDHWPGVWSALIAGAGVRGGQIVGASDALGGAPADRPVSPAELLATIDHALGRAPRTSQAAPVWELFG